MELTKQDTRVLKGIAILLMVLLHMYATKEVDGLYNTFPLINDTPLVYYIALIGDACRPIYLFVTGYAFYIVINNNQGSVFKKNLNRILKLYINLWIVILIFVPIGLIIGRDDIFTLDLTNFLMNFFALSNSYNGAWWFVQIYIIFVLSSPFLIGIVNKSNPFLLMIISGTVYFISHLQRYKELINFGDNDLILWIVRILFLIGTSQFSFFIGSIFAKEKILTRIHNKIGHVKNKNFFCLITLLSLFIFHAIVESSIIAPINGIAIICLYSLWEKKQIQIKLLSFLSEHSTNIWLTHMFFYMSIFPQVIFIAEYPLFIFIWIIFLCIVTSYVIKIFTKPIYDILDRKKFVLARSKYPI